MAPLSCSSPLCGLRWSQFRSPSSRDSPVAVVQIHKLIGQGFFMLYGELKSAFPNTSLRNIKRLIQHFDGSSTTIMSTSPSPTSVDPTRIMPGSFEKSVAETEYDAWTISVTDTPYVAKSAQANQSTAWDSVRTALFPWLTLRTSQDLSNGNGGRHIQSMFKNASLLAIVGLFWLFGTAGMSWLWYIWRSKAIWLVINILS